MARHTGHMSDVHDDADRLGIGAGADGIPGVGVGHWTNHEARTGCTVVVVPPGTTASGEVRGGAPATREFALLDPTRTVSTIDAVILSGGSAFGLAAADGVVAELETSGRGFPTGHGPIPIVIGMSLYDLGVGKSSVRPGPQQGRLAYRAALDSSDPSSSGLVGAGTGATVGKWTGNPSDGGLGAATVAVPVEGGQLRVMAVIAVNAFGSIDDGSLPEDPGPPKLSALAAGGEVESGSAATSAANTTIGVVVTNARSDKPGCYLMAQSGHDGLARCLLPAHTAFDGDALVVAATGQVEANPIHLRALVQVAVVRAVRSLGATTL